jgi:hypothetical protein
MKNLRIVIMSLLSLTALLDGVTERMAKRLHEKQVFTHSSRVKAKSTVQWHKKWYQRRLAVEVEMKEDAKRTFALFLFLKTMIVLNKNYQDNSGNKGLEQSVGAISLQDK